MYVKQLIRCYRATNWTKKTPVMVLVDNRRNVWIDFGGVNCSDMGILPKHLPLKKQYVLKFANA